MVFAFRPEEGGHQAGRLAAGNPCHFDFDAKVLCFHNSLCPFYVCVCPLGTPYITLKAHNSKSFVHKFMNVVKKTIQSGSKTVQMTSNEFSIPTSTFFVSEAIRSCLLNNKYHGILHAVPTTSQSVSRLDFAKAILNSFPANTEYCGVKLTDIEIEGVVRDTYQPTYSALYTSFSHMMPRFDWLQLLEKFIHKNADELLK